MYIRTYRVFHNTKKTFYRKYLCYIKDPFCSGILIRAYSLGLDQTAAKQTHNPTRQAVVSRLERSSP